VTTLISGPFKEGQWKSLIAVTFLSVLWAGSGVASSDSSGVHPVVLPTTGACCSPYGLCTMSTVEECTAPSIYLGDVTSCTPIPCPIPLGACCMPDGTCSLWTEEHHKEAPLAPGARSAASRHRHRLLPSHVSRAG
jgi:hypothetical protein